MKPARWFLLVFVIAVLGSGAVVAVNVTVDPEGLYFKHLELERSIGAFAERVAHAETGFREPSDDRLLKRALVAQADGRRCAIIGSSRAKLLSSLHKRSPLGRRCKTAMNFGVDHGGFEHDVMMWGLLRDRPARPRTVVLAIDGWTLRRGGDEGFERWSGEIGSLVLDYGGTWQEAPKTHTQRVMENAINAGYLRASARVLVSAHLDGAVDEGDEADEGDDDEVVEDSLALIEPVTARDVARARRTIVRSDGSLVYSRKAFARRKGDLEKAGGGDFGLGDPVVDEGVAAVVTALLREMKARSKEVILLLTPYHPNVFAPGNATTAQRLRTAEARWRAIADDVGVSLVGSFDPAVVGCGADEFIDRIHPLAPCIDRIAFPAR